VKVVWAARRHPAECTGPILRSVVAGLDAAAADCVTHRVAGSSIFARLCPPLFRTVSTPMRGGRGGTPRDALPEPPRRLCPRRAAGIPTAFWRGVSRPATPFRRRSFIDEGWQQQAKAGSGRLSQARWGHRWPGALSGVLNPGDGRRVGPPLPADAAAASVSSPSHLLSQWPSRRRARCAISVHRIVCAATGLAVNPDTIAARGGGSISRPLRCTAPYTENGGGTETPPIADADRRFPVIDDLVKSTSSRRYRRGPRAALGARGECDFRRHRQAHRTCRSIRTVEGG